MNGKPYIHMPLVWYFQAKNLEHNRKPSLFFVFLDSSYILSKPHYFLKVKPSLLPLGSVIVLLEDLHYITGVLIDFSSYYYHVFRS